MQWLQGKSLYLDQAVMKLLPWLINWQNILMITTVVLKIIAVANILPGSTRWFLLLRTCKLLRAGRVESLYKVTHLPKQAGALESEGDIHRDQEVKRRYLNGLRKVGIE